METPEEIKADYPRFSIRQGFEYLKTMIVRIWRFYYEGFKEMTVGKTLWAIILIKLFIMFAILKLFFFPDILKENYDNDADRAAHVRQELIKKR